MSYDDDEMTSDKHTRVSFGDGLESKGADKPTNSRLVKPVIVISAPRAGSTLLFETLARSPDARTIGHESHGIIERIAKLHPRRRGFDSNRLLSVDAGPQVARTIRQAFLERLKDRNRRPLGGEVAAVRMIEKTPKNALRVPFLNAVFADARFVYLYRDPRENLSSIMEAWRSGRYVSYRNLPDWPGPPWSLLLIPRWRELAGRPLAEIAAAQWACANQTILDDLSQLPPERWTAVKLDDLLRDPAAEIERLCRFAELAWDRPWPTTLSPSRSTLTAPAADKWKKNAPEVLAALPRVVEVADRAEAFITEAHLRRRR